MDVEEASPWAHQGVLPAYLGGDEQMTGRRIYLWHVQMVASLFACLVFFLGVETFSGGICEYWRCIPMTGVLLQAAMVLLALVSIWSLMSVLLEGRKK